MELIIILFELLELQSLIIPDFIFVILGFLIPIFIFMAFIELSVFKIFKRRNINVINRT